MATGAESITVLLRRIRKGSRTAQDELVGVVYSDLRHVAHRYMSRERPDHTIQATALVHEAYLRIFDGAQVEWQDRAHFFAVAAGQMRRVLQDHGRRFRAGKRGGGLKVV